jgi:hypothetical protein
VTRTADVIVEVVVLRVDADGRLAYRVAHQQLGAGAPDSVALDTAGLTHPLAPVPVPAGTVSHSTSWRYDSGCVVLTYAVVPDPHPHLPVESLPRVGVVCSPDPLHPSPAGLHDHHVAAHAVRHLAYLWGTDPTVARAAATRPQIWQALNEYATSTTVGDHHHSHQPLPTGDPLTRTPRAVHA